MYKIIKAVFENRRLAVTLLVSLCLCMTCYAIAIHSLRIALPVQLSVFEGKVLSQAVEFAEGNKIYRDPAEYGAADMYPPLYMMLIGLIYRFAEPSFLWGRLLSAMASVIAGFLIIYHFWRYSNRNWLVVFILAALFASVSWHTMWYYSALKTDALCHLVWLVGLSLLLVKQKHSCYVVASAVVLALAFFVKQTALFAVPAAFMFLLLDRKRNALIFAASYIVSWLLFLMILTWIAGEWMPQFFFQRMATQSGGGYSFAGLFRNALAFGASPFIIAGAAFAVSRCAKLWNVAAYRLAILAFPFMFAGSVLTASSVGGNLNSLLPGYYAFLVLAGFGVCEIMRDKHSVVSCWFCCFLLIFEIDINTPYNISKARGRFDQDFVETVDFLRQQEGSMYAPSHNVLTLLAGRRHFDDRVLAGYIYSWAPAAAERINLKINSGKYDSLIMARHEEDMRVLNEDARLMYETARDFGSWIVLRRVNSK